MIGLKALRRRIASIKSTQQITRAMKMVAAARLRRAHERIIEARPYAGILAHAIAAVARVPRVARLASGIRPGARVDVDGYDTPGHVVASTQQAVR